MKNRKLTLTILLAASISLACTGCNIPFLSGNTAATESAADVSGTVTAESEAESAGQSESAATEAETETTSPYNEDGTRKAWINAETRLNVRAEASADSEFIGSFNARQQIKLLEEEPVNGFYHVSGTNSKNGEEITGYASSEFITTDAPEDPKVSLDVILYSQYNDAWKDVTLGSTKKTMYDYGCATCCLAMSESYLKNSGDTPDIYAETYRYTQKGDVVWPKDYYWNYNKDLSFIYNKLKAGIPVLVNATKKNGSPHWVLVVGYTGDGVDLKSEDFRINDPLPFGRTNLKEFFKTYPRFKKMIYYCEDRALVEGSNEWNEAHGIAVTETTEEE